MTVNDASTGTRERVLAAIRTASVPVTVDEVADELGLHHNSIRSHAVELQRAGLIAQSTRTSGRRGRPSITYRVTNRGAWSGGRDYGSLASVLIAHLYDTHEEPVAAARQAGHAWGRSLAAEHPTGHNLVASTLDELGFEPQGDQDPIELRNCPFRELVDSHRDVVCAIHAGMLDGLVDGSRVSVDLLPFTSPTACTVRLTST